MAKVLVVGGAGYVGSGICSQLLDQGHQIHILDNLSTGHRELALGGHLVVGKAGDSALIAQLVKDHRYDCAMHFAAKSVVPESFQKPDEYYENNVTQTKILLDTLLQGGVKTFIFSSTAAIFGDPGDKKIDESMPCNPLSPYGKNKLEVEQHLKVLSETKGLKAIALRYFNAAGAEPKNRVGEWHENESHLIPRLLAWAQKEQPVEVYGEDYPTPDGTCIRDYVHISDLASAHVLAMERLLKLNNAAFEAYNLGSEEGFSVLEVVKAVRDVTGAALPVVYKGRRSGDAPRLVADSTRAKKNLGYQPKFKKIEDITKTAWAWQKRLTELKRKAAV
jgi:UDP-glucose 4-epimerase